jgi:WD40 repeat protein
MNYIFYLFFCVSVLVRPSLLNAQTLSDSDSLTMKLSVGHSKTITESKFSLNDQFIVTMAYNEIKIWDAASGKIIREYYHPIQIACFDISKDNKYLVVSDVDGNFLKWNIVSGLIENKVKLELSWLNKFKLNKDNSEIMAYDISSQYIYFLSMNNFNNRKEYKISEDISAINITSDFKYIAYGTNDNKFSILNVASGKTVVKINNLSTPPEQITFDDSCKRVAVVTQAYYEKKQEILIVDIMNNKEMFRRSSIDEIYGNIVFDKTGTKIAGFWNNSLRVVDIISNLTKKATATFPESAFNTLSFSPDNKMLLWAGGNSDKIWNSSDFGFLYFIDSEKMNIIDSVFDHASFIRSINFSHEGNKFITTAYSEGDGVYFGDEFALVWNFNTKKLIHKLSGKAVYIDNLFLNHKENNEVISVAKSESSISIFDLKSPGIKNIISLNKLNSDILKAVDLSNDGEFIIAGYESLKTNDNDLKKISVEIHSFDSRNVLNTFSFMENETNSFWLDNIRFLKDDQHIFISGLGINKLLNVSNFSQAKNYSFDNGISSITPLNNNELFLVHGSDILRLDLKNNQVDTFYKHCEWEEMYDHYFSALKCSNDGKTLVSAKIETAGVDLNLVAGCRTHDVDSLYSIQIWNVLNGTLIRQFRTVGGVIRSIDISNDNKYILTASDDGIIRIWDLQTGILNASFLGHKTEAGKTMYILDDQYIISTSSDYSVRLWKTQTKMEIFTRYTLSQNNWLVKLPNSPYYMCSKEASKMLHYVTPDLKVIGFDQLDPIYNRPDIVLDSIGKYFADGPDFELIKQYKDAWVKRMNRLGIDTSASNNKIEVPEAEIVNAENIDFNNSSGKLNFRLKASDSKHTLRRYNVFVNEVPVYGSGGIPISGNIKQFEKDIEIQLSERNNKIQVSVMNDLGLESFKYPLYVQYQPVKPVVSNTYYIGIGVDSFTTSNFNLQYCVKDVNDLGSLLAKSSNTKTTILKNKGVTKENVLKLKELLKQTTEQDKVIISCSSHGLLDNNNNFYLAMHNVDFDRPEINGLAYEDLLGLLDSIPARKKLLLLDACNSGENETTVNKKLRDQNNVVLNTGTKGIKIDSDSSRVEKSSFESMLELFVNVNNQTGTTVISAAGGKQSAFEGDRVLVNGQPIKNGAFTYSIIEYLTENAKDKNKLTVNQLKQYAEQRVSEITNGNQKPTSRQETMEVDWGF